MKRSRFVESRAHPGTTSAAADPIDLPRDMYIESVRLDHRGSINYSGAPTLLPNGEYRILTGLTLLVNGLAVQTISVPELLALSNRLDRGAASDLDPIAAATGAQAYGFSLEIPLASLRARIMRARGALMGSLCPAFAEAFIRQMQVQWTYALPTAMATGGTLAAHSATTRVSVVERARGTRPQGPGGLIQLVRSSIVETWGATATDRRIRLPLQGLLRRLVLLADDDGTLSSTIVTSLKVERNGATIWGPQTFTELRAENIDVYSLGGAIATPGALLNAGEAAIDWNTGGDLVPSTLVNAAGSQTLDLIIDVGAPTATQGRLRVLTEAWRPYPLV